jgi:hypothetical protein
MGFHVVRLEVIKRKRLWKKKSLEVVTGNGQPKSAVEGQIQKGEDLSVCNGASTMELVSAL